MCQEKDRLLTAGIHGNEHHGNDHHQLPGDDLPGDHVPGDAGVSPDDETVNETDVTKLEIVWFNVYTMAVLHLLAFWGFYQGAVYAMWRTLAFCYLLYFCGGLGITAGAHRLWAHRSYKAKLPLRVFLMLCQTNAGQDDVYQWSRDHRVHHKWSETNADPYNANRGMFFAHIGWLLIKKHQDVITYGKKLNYDDILNDPVVKFQRRHYKLLFWMVCVILPTLIPWWCWSEDLLTSFLTAACARYVVILHATWLVNSLAHYYGIRPYDSAINPAENRLVSSGALGEGFHNFHHSFPFDYQSSEMGYSLNATTLFIDIMYCLGQAYDLRTVPKHVINSRKERTGDKTGARRFFRPTYMKVE